MVYERQLRRWGCGVGGGGTKERKGRTQGLSFGLGLQLGGGRRGGALEAGNRPGGTKRTGDTRREEALRGQGEKSRQCVVHSKRQLYGHMMELLILGRRARKVSLADLAMA